jgi:hypothetical protein
MAHNLLSELLFYLDGGLIGAGHEVVIDSDSESVLSVNCHIT